MNYKISEINPIEAIRLAERISQKDFAKNLGYPNKDRYTHHMRNFTQDVIDRVKAVYDRDIAMEIINHLRYKCRELQKQLKQTNKLSKSDSNTESPVRSINSILDRI